jgi:hypothetical protein
LLANILLDDLDQELENRGHRFVRYMDDLVILVKSVRAGKGVFASALPKALGQDEPIPDPAAEAEGESAQVTGGECPRSGVPGL